MTAPAGRSTTPGRRRRVRPVVDTYTIVHEAVERGATFGWRRAHKHTDAPDEDAAIEQIAHEVMLALDEVVRWG